MASAALAGMDSMAISVGAVVQLVVPGVVASAVAASVVAALAGATTASVVAAPAGAPVVSLADLQQVLRAQPPWSGERHCTELPQLVSPAKQGKLLHCCAQQRSSSHVPPAFWLHETPAGLPTSVVPSVLQTWPKQFPVLAVLPELPATAAAAVVDGIVALQQMAWVHPPYLSDIHCRALPKLSVLAGQG